METSRRSVELVPPAVPQTGTGSMTAPEKPVIVIHSLADLLTNPSILQPPDIVVPRLAWAGRVTLLAAREKTGKSTLAAAGCAAVSWGHYHLGGFVNVGNVLWLSADNESLHDQIARFQRFGAEPKNVYLWENWDHQPESFLNSVRDYRPRLAVVDTLAGFAALSITDASSSAAWTPLMLDIKRTANETGAAILLVHHANKSDGRYRDSTAIGAHVDCILEMEADDHDSTLRRIRARARWYVEGYAFRLLGDTYALADHAGPTVTERIVHYVRGNPGCSKNAIRAAVRGRHSELDHELGVLEQQGVVENQGATNRCRYYPNPSAPLEGLGNCGPQAGADAAEDHPPQGEPPMPLRGLAGRDGADAGADETEPHPPHAGGSIGPPAGRGSQAAELDAAA